MITKDLGLRGLKSLPDHGEHSHPRLNFMITKDLVPRGPDPS
jgi:hypothetical protein